MKRASRTRTGPLTSCKLHLGWTDPALNLSLAVAVDLRKARASDVPEDNIATALARIFGPACPLLSLNIFKVADLWRDSATQSVVYEALGPRHNQL